MIEPLTKEETKQIYNEFPELKKSDTDGGFVETPVGIGVLKGIAKFDGKLVANISHGVFTHKYYEIFFSKEKEEFLFGQSAQKFLPIEI